MANAIVFQAGFLGMDAPIYMHDGTTTTELFEIEGVLRNAIGVSEGFAFTESRAFNDFLLNVYDGSSGAVTNVYSDDIDFADASLNAFQGGAIFKNVNVPEADTLLLYQNGQIVQLLSNTAAPFTRTEDSEVTSRDFVGFSGDYIYTSGGDEGTELAIINTRDGSVSFEDFTDGFADNGSPKNFVEAGGGVYFLGNFDNGGSSLFTGGSGLIFGSSGSFSVISEPQDPGPGPTIDEIAYAGGTLFMSGGRLNSIEPNDPNAEYENGLFVLGSGPFGMELVFEIDFEGSGRPREFASLNDVVLFEMETKPLFNGEENLFVSDGTRGGTIQLTNGLTDIDNLTVGDDLAYFFGTSERFGTELWVTDGTPVGTRQVIDLVPGEEGQDSAFGIGPATVAPSIAILDDVAYFTGTTGVVDSLINNTAGLYKSDGTADGTSLVLVNGLMPFAVTLNSSISGGSPVDPTEGADELFGTTVAELVSALGGDDVIRASGGNDTVDGGSGFDMLVLNGEQDDYTLTISETGAFIADRLNGRDDITFITDIEQLNFNDGSSFSLENFDDAAALQAGDLEAIVELYVAYFDRAPDAIGLNFWASAFARGEVDLNGMAELFFDQAETRSIYASLLNEDGSQITDGTAFVTAIFTNVLGRAPDQGGLDFWVDVLGRGDVTPGAAISSMIEGAKADAPSDATQAERDARALDQQYLSNATDIGVHFAVISGMSSTANADFVMDLLTRSSDSVSTAVAQSSQFLSDSQIPVNGEFLMPLLGVVDDPFAG